MGRVNRDRQNKSLSFLNTVSWHINRISNEGEQSECVFSTETKTLNVLLANVGYLSFAGDHLDIFKSLKNFVFELSLQLTERIFKSLKSFCVMSVSFP